MALSCPRVCFFSLVLLVCTIIASITHISLTPLKAKVDSQLSKTFYNRLDKYDPKASHGPDVTVRSVYFDRRQRYGHQNTYVFLIEVRKHYLYKSAGLILGCEVGDQISHDIKIHPIYINGKTGKLIDERPSLTHAMAMVDCFNIPAQNTSKAALLYRTSSNGFILPAVSERPLFVSRHDNQQGDHTPRIAACMAVVYGSPTYLEDWLQYQKEIGISHVHIIAEDSFEKNGGLKLPYMKNALSSGFLSVDVWKVWLKTNREIHYHSQMLAYHDCIYRFQNTYDYVMMADHDDFFVPLHPNRTTLHWYIENWCPKGACVFDWLEYYPDCGLSKEKSVPPGNLTSRLVSDAVKVLSFKKSLYRVLDTVEVGVHDPREMMPLTGGVAVPSSEAYVAHLRTNRRPPSGC